MRQNLPQNFCKKGELKKRKPLALSKRPFVKHYYQRLFNVAVHEEFVS